MPKAPTIAPMGSIAAKLGKTTKLRYATKEAPPVTPMVVGEARLLRITACKIQPDKAKQRPTRPPVSIRGSLRL